MHKTNKFKDWFK